MKSIKEKGMKEINAFKTRLARVYLRDGITATDYDYIEKRVHEIEARVVSMREEGADEF